MKKFSVTIIMSTYNGEKYISRQLDSLFEQEGVDVNVFIRDDGSNDNTLDILKRYKEKNRDYKLIIEKGKNVGWRKSFLLALYNAPEADFFAFSDQDDVWFPNKLSTCINKMINDPSDEVLLVHHNRCRCDLNFNPLHDSSKRLIRPLNKKNALIQEFAQGCTMVFNKAAWLLIKKYSPKSNVAHDLWVGMLCYYFGKVYFVKEPLIYHIQYGSNASATGNVFGGRLARAKAFFNSQSVYVNVADDLLSGYGELLDRHSFLMNLRDYKRSFFSRLRLLFDFSFRRSSLIGTLSLKIAILMGKM